LARAISLCCCCRAGCGCACALANKLIENRTAKTAGNAFCAYRLANDMAPPWFPGPDIGCVTCGFVNYITDCVAASGDDSNVLQGLYLSMLAAGQGGWHQAVDLEGKRT